MTTYIVISYIQTEINNTTAILYVDETEKHFASRDNSIEYAEWLQKIYPQFTTIVYVQDVLQDNELDLNNIKRQHALSKLNDEDKQLLGISDL